MIFHISNIIIREKLFQKMIQRHRKLGMPPSSFLHSLNFYPNKVFYMIQIKSFQSFVIE